MERPGEKPLAKFWFEDHRLKSSGPEKYFSGYQTESHEGSFFFWEKKADRLTLENDFFGFNAVYYKYTDGVLRVSNDIAKLVAAGEPLDYRALAVFIRTGFYLNNSTPFAAISLLPANSKLEFTSSGIRIIKKENMVLANRVPDAGGIQQEYTRIFANSIAELKDIVGTGSSVLPLSGGRDSRHILLELTRQNAVPDICITVKHQPPKSNEDFLVASLLAGQLGISHTGIWQNPDLNASEIVKNRETNFSALEHAWFTALCGYIREHKVDYVYDGIAGDVLTAGSIMLNTTRNTMAREGRWVELAEDLIGKEGLLPVMFTEEYISLLPRAEAVADVTEELMKYADTANPIGQFYFWNRARRTIGSSAFSMLGSSTTTLAPFLNRKLYQLMASVPAEFFIEQHGKRFHDRIIAASYPEHAHIRFEDRGLDNQKSKLRQRLNTNLALMQKLQNAPDSRFSKIPILSRAIYAILSARYNDSSTLIFRMITYMDCLENSRNEKNNANNQFWSENICR